MFKSLMQPIQLFLKGATGKDRHQKQQLMQQLSRLQLSYERLQESCDTMQQEQYILQEKNNRLQIECKKLQREYEGLQRDRNEFRTLFNYADKENVALNADTDEMRSHLDDLEEENIKLQGRVVYLEYKLGLREYDDDEVNFDLARPDLTKSDSARSAATEKQLAHQALSSDVGLGNFLEDESIEGEIGALPIVDLSNISLALVGGHEATHREVSEELKKYGLKRCIYVPPRSRESNTRHQIRDKIGNCDLVVTITSYIDHSVSKCVKQLKETEGLAGEVIRVHCHGKSGVVREVLQYFAS